MKHFYLESNSDSNLGIDDIIRYSSDFRIKQDYFSNPGLLEVLGKINLLNYTDYHFGYSLCNMDMMEREINYMDFINDFTNKVSTVYAEIPMFLWLLKDNSVSVIYTVGQIREKELVYIDSNDNFSNADGAFKDVLIKR